MTKQEYERVRQEVAKKYKDKIADLEKEKAILGEWCKEKDQENKELKAELKRLRAAYDHMPDSVKGMIKVFNQLI